MSALAQISRNFLLHKLRTDVKVQINNKCISCLRLLSYSPREYDGNPNPAPIFIQKEVQSLLKTLTRIDLARVYRKRKLGGRHLEQPTYKFMTDHQLQEVLDEMKQKVDVILQIPPVVPVRKPIDKIIARDPALTGFDTVKYIFTDITFGVRDSERVIVIRDTDGTLREAEWEVRDRINQMYFPVNQRSIKIPKMFQDNYFDDILNRREYEFILDRACLQFAPNDPLYQKVVTITYQHINDNNAFEVLRSTRHFGGLAFFLAWNKMIDNLLLDLIETSHINEASALIDLYGKVHNVTVEGDDQLKVIQEYVKKFADKKGALELAIQAYKDVLRQKEELEKGIQRAHGLS